jgi:hypothetical protein
MIRRRRLILKNAQRGEGEVGRGGEGKEEGVEHKREGEGVGTEEPMGSG